MCMKCFNCVYRCALHVYLMPMEVRRGTESPRLSSAWVLGPELESPSRETIVL